MQMIMLIEEALRTHPSKVAPILQEHLVLKKNQLVDPHLQSLFAYLRTYHSELGSQHQEDQLFAQIEFISNLY